MRRSEREKSALPAGVRDFSRAVSSYMTSVILNPDVSRRCHRMSEKKKENPGKGRVVMISKGKQLTGNRIISV